jgi:hypothetical protein
MKADLLFSSKYHKTKWGKIQTDHITEGKITKPKCARR